MNQQRAPGCFGCGCFGCGGSTLLALILLGLAAWFFVLKPARDFMAGMKTQPTQTQTTTQTPPAQPTDTTQPLGQTDVQKFVRIRREIRTALGDSFTGVQQVWTDIENGQNPNLLQVMNVLRQAGSSINAARTAQSDALKKEKMSTERYNTVRSAINRALGIPSIDFAKAAQAIQNGQLPDLNTTLQPATPEEQQLVQPFKQELQNTAAIGLLGL